MYSCKGKWDFWEHRIVISSGQLGFLDVERNDKNILQIFIMLGYYCPFDFNIFYFDLNVLFFNNCEFAPAALAGFLLLVINFEINETWTNKL
jgi:hypothetical protein